MLNCLFISLAILSNKLLMWALEDKAGVTSYYTGDYGKDNETTFSENTQRESGLGGT